ncbi:nicotinate-nucleotide diphosphorylase (carboxylating), partial [Klebsiella pneumoniae]
RVTMSRHVGVVRDGDGLARARGALERLRSVEKPAVAPDIAAWEATNLLTVASFVAACAAARRESRGAHWRSDHPGHSRDDHGACGAGVLNDEGEVRLLGGGSRVAWRPPEQLTAELVELLPEANSRHPQDRRLGTLELVRQALAEDLCIGGGADVTSAATIPAGQIRTADVVARADGVVAGLPVAELVFWVACGGAVQVERHVADGDRVRRGDLLMSVAARTRDLLTAERTALNFLTHLSGIATATAAWVDAVA